MPKAKVNGIELYYQIHGQGYPVVFLHGFTYTVDMWQPQVAAISRGYRMVAYDARGHGQSESPSSPDQYSADIVVEDLCQLMTALGINKAVLAGHSNGGYQSMRFYIRYPQMVTALILIDSGPGFRNPARMEEWNQQQEELATRYENRGSIGLANMARKVVAQHDSSVIESLGEIKVPTLVLVGDGDRAFLQSADYMSGAIPGAEKMVVPGAGHNANQDNAEFVNEAVLDFLKKLNLPGG